MTRHLLFLLLAMAISFGVLAETRGIAVMLRADESRNAPVAETVELYGGSYALVIGIDNYTGGWPRLSSAVNDARAVADELDRQGFDVTLETDLTASRLDRSLKEFFAIKGSDPDARLLLWFAGHGHTLRGEGFLVPADAPPASDPRFKVRAIHMRDFGGLVRLAESRHVLAVFDSCFSGTIFSARAGSPPAAITKMTTKPVRQFLTSGDAGQQVRDDGSFRKLFLRALRGEERADVNGDGYLTAEELGLFLSQEVAMLTSAAQTPKHGKLHDVEFNQGDFVFVLPRRLKHTVGGINIVEPNGALPEMLYWQSIRESNNAADFEAYIEQFPHGTFAALARNRLDALSRPQIITSSLGSIRVVPLDQEFIAVKNANVRAEPTTKARKIGLLKLGTAVIVTGRSQISGMTWYRVPLPGEMHGYVFGDLLQEGISSAEPPRVIDGDTIDIAGQRIRLHGIDAPESKQTCRRSGKPWNCGSEATRTMQKLVGKKIVRCVGQDQDKYGRTIGICYADGTNINAAIVSAGMALAYRQYSQDYIDEEISAKAAMRGLWEGEFVPPWEWRRGSRLSGAALSQNNPNSCQIKGNISSAGERIFHVPGTRWYDHTQINPSKGERWFCTEDEAVKAGWRKVGELSSTKTPPASSLSKPATRKKTDCCKVCRKGKPCGNSCISWSKTCRRPPGCACSAE